MRARCLSLAVVGLLVALTPGVGAQTGSIAGTIRDSATGTPLAGARIRALAPLGEVVGSALANVRGRFRIGPLEQGRYALVVSHIGYVVRRLEDIVVPAGNGAAELAIALTSQTVALDPVVITASRNPEALLDAPASVSLVDRLAIEERPSLSPVDQLRDLPGVEFVSKGLIQRSFAARGPNAVNSAALLVLTDYRLASLPSLRLNVPYLIPTGPEDLERIELARGPGSALYGPDADRGVLHFITRSPFASGGSSLSVAGGGRSLFHSSVRHARTLSTSLAVKLSGEYFRGSDWPFTDVEEQSRRDSALASGALADTLRIGRRDSRVERAAGEARLDWLPGPTTSVTLSGGLAQAISAVDLTEIGAVQVRDWRSSYLQGRLTRGLLFVNLFYNGNDAGRTYQLRTGDRVAEDSRLFAAQLQHGITLHDTRSISYGIDLQRVVPRTSGTIHGRNEGDDNITQLGAFVRSAIPLSSKLILDVAARGDHHDRLDDLALSPRAALVFRPDTAQAFRLTFNRGTSTPVANDLFIDLDLGPLHPSLPYRLRAGGTIRGYTFRRDCGGLCLSSPFAPGLLPLDATLLWDVIRTAIPQLASVPAPSSQEVATVLADAGSFDPVSAAEVTDIPRGRRSVTTTFELGYKQYFADRFSAAVDIHRTRITHVGNPLSVVTPNAFLEAGSLESYLVRNGFSPTDAAALASAAAEIPLGIVSPSEAPTPTDILLVARQGGAATYWGLDVALELKLTQRVSLDGAYSWVSKDRIPNGAGLSDIVFNSPKHHASLAVAFRDEPGGFNAEVRTRAVGSFPVKSGVYEGRVQSYALVDANLGYRLPWANDLTVSIAGYNVLDRRHREFVGVPEIGRLLMARIRVSF